LQVGDLAARLSRLHQRLLAAPDEIVHLPGVLVVDEPDTMLLEQSG
jgi:hypothetical protein